MLKMIYSCIETAKTGDGGDEMIKECLDTISNIYLNFPEFRKSK